MLNEELMWLVSDFLFKKRPCGTHRDNKRLTIVTMEKLLDGYYIAKDSSSTPFQKAARPSYDIVWA